MTGDQAAALAHARWIVELEQTLGIAVEASVTGNHFVVDIVAGIALTSLGFGAARLADGRRRTRTRPAFRPVLASGDGRHG